MCVYKCAHGTLQVCVCMYMFMCVCKHLCAHAYMVHVWSCMHMKARNQPWEFFLRLSTARAMATGLLKMESTDLVIVLHRDLLSQLLVSGGGS